LADFQDGLNAYDKQDYATALKEWQPLAKQGNADAQNNLGTMYANGKGVLKDAKQAKNRVCIILKLTPYFLPLFF
jgi:TPR repeat protein